MLKAFTFQPMLSTLLRDRRFGIFVSGAAALQVILTFFRFPAWPCPFFHMLGIPCPGCGMTRATLFLMEGHLKQSLTMHAFAPLAVIVIALFAFATIAPRAQVQWLTIRTERLERYTGLTTFMLAGLILYWLARLVILQTAFVRLIQG